MPGPTMRRLACEALADLLPVIPDNPPFKDCAVEWLAHYAGRKQSGKEVPVAWRPSVIAAALNVLNIEVPRS